MKNYLRLCAISLSLTLLTGCQSPSYSNAPRFNPRATGVFSNVASGFSLEKTIDPSLLQPDQELFRIGPGDQLQVEILGRVSTRSDMTVGPDGKIYFDLLPGIDVWGLSVGQAKRTLEKELNNYMTGSQVSLTLRSVGSKHIWMLGSIEHPGTYPTTSPITLLEAMSLAGGTRRAVTATATADLADLRHAFVIRKGQTLPVDFHRLLEQGDMSQNIYLKPDDFVYVPSGAQREIYLFGAVRSPRTMPLSEHPTLIAAIAAGGGPLPNAFISQVAIVRGSLTSPQMAIVDYNEIISGKAGDILLEPHDIVFVPYSPYRILRGYMESILSTFVNTVAANEGVNAFSDVGRVGVSVPVGGN